MSKAGILTTTWITIVCVAGAARLIGNSHSGSSFSGNSDSEQISRAQQLGVPIDQSALEGKPVPPDQNAAVIYDKVSDTLTADPTLKKTIDGVVISIVRQNPTKSEIDDAEKGRIKNDAALITLKPILDLTPEIQKRTLCDFGPMEDANGATSWNKVNAARSVAKLLCIKADYQDRQGDWKGALDSMRLASHASHDVGSPGGLSAMLSESFGRTIVRNEYQVLVQRHSHDAPFLEAAQNQLESERSLPDLRHGTIGVFVDARQEMHLINSMKDLQDEFGVRAQNNSISQSLVSGVRLQNDLDALLMAQWIDLYRRLPKDGTDWQSYSRLFQEFNGRVQGDGSPLNAFNEEIFSQLVGGADRTGETQASDRILYDSIELLRIRAKTGKFPLILPKNFGKDRLDPFDGNPLRYRVEGGGFTLYSIGSDRVDNGGHMRSSNDAPNAGVDIVESFH